MRQETREVNIFIASDGTEFLEQSMCEEYEKRLIEVDKRIKSLKYFTIHYAADLTEGRGFASTIHLAIEPYGYINPEIWVNYWASSLGEYVEFVQGVSPTPGLRVTERTKFDWEWAERTSTTHLFISERGEIDGYPEPVRFFNKKQEFKDYVYAQRK